MKTKLIFLAVMCSVICRSLPTVAATPAEDAPLTPASVIERSAPEDWRQPDQNRLLHLTTESGEVIFELAPDFAPAHVSNVKQLVSQRYYDGLAITRSQDNYVAQWGDPNAGTPEAKSLGKAKASLQGEYFSPRKAIALTPIDSRDAYADSVGFAGGFAVGADTTRAWLTHCYGALGAGRGMAADSGNGAELYVVTGHSPRHLDRNVTLLGRAIAGMEHLSSLPRGSGALGFYENPEQAMPIVSMRLGSELSPKQQSRLEIMRTDTDTFAKYVRSRTYRKNPWFIDQTGKISVCNVGVPVRPVTRAATP
ncbi:MAG: peptidylprolyl isomerase [Gammaproteobacteria bacterium]